MAISKLLLLTRVRSAFYQNNLSPTLKLALGNTSQFSLLPGNAIHDAGCSSLYCRQKNRYWKVFSGLNSFHICPVNLISETSPKLYKSYSSKRQISPYLYTCEGRVLVGFYNHVIGFNISQSQNDILPPPLFQNLPKTVTPCLEKSSSQYVFLSH